MGYSEAFKDIGTNRNTAASYYTTVGNTAAVNDVAKEPVSFDRVFREQHITDIATEQVTAGAEDSLTVSAGAEIEKLARMSQMRDMFFADELEMFEETDDLDEAIGLDEAEELDMIAEDEASQRADLVDESFDDDMGSELSADDDLLTFSDM